MKTFLQPSAMASIATVPMTTVATQTDGCVDIGYQELCGSLSEMNTIDIYDWEEEDEVVVVGNATGNRQRVMSSQTDLALSNFDLSQCLEWEDDDDEEEDGEDEGAIQQRIPEDCDGGDDDDGDAHIDSADVHVYATLEEDAGCIAFDPNITVVERDSPTYETIDGIPSSPEDASWSTELVVTKSRDCFQPCRQTFAKEFRRTLGRPSTGHDREVTANQKTSQICGDSVQDSCGQEPFLFRNRMVPRMGTKVEFLKQSPEHRSTQLPKSWPRPPSLSELNVASNFRMNAQEDRHVNGYHSDSEHSYVSIRESVRHKEWSSDGDADSISQSLEDEFERSLKSINIDLLSPESLSKVESLRHAYDHFADIMYTNHANLQHTIMVQQCLFKQQLACRKLQEDIKNKKSANNPADVSLIARTSREPPGIVCKTQKQTDPSCSRSKIDEKSQLEWIVKRRQDGSRYITRRPVRSKLLKERAKQLAAQHENLLSTDDDTASEVKIGRYWSKEERKCHLEKARSQKRQKENQLKLHTGGGTKGGGGGVTPQQQHKLSKHRSRKILENCSTIKDLMLQRSADNKAKSFSPLLSVTTI